MYFFIVISIYKEYKNPKDIIISFGQRIYENDYMLSFYLMAKIGQNTFE